MADFLTTYSSVFLVAVLVVSLLVLWYRSRCRGDLPPGPRPLPVVGNLHLFLRRDARKVLQELGETYGDVFTFHLGPMPIVVFNSYDSNKEAMSMDELSGRPDLTVLVKGVFPTNSGIVTSEGSVWKTNRKLCLRHLSQMGFGKKRFEREILEEVSALLDRVERKQGERFDIKVHLANSVSNLICQMVFGRRYEPGSTEFEKLLKAIADGVLIPIAYALMPFLVKIPIVNGPMLKFQAALKYVDSVVARYLDEHKNETAEPDGNDILHVYINGQRKEDDSHKALDPAVFEDAHIRGTVVDLFAAGTETTTTTLRWALVYLLNFPDIQEKLRAEIHEVVGINRMPSLNDKPSMPVTQAFLAEVQRHASLIPLGISHRATEHVRFRGYTIPKDTQIITNIYAVSMDERHFPCAHMFRPERFLDASGQFKATLAEKMIPFGIGKRVCLGESLARMELFLFLTSLVQRFEFASPKGAERPSMGGKAEFISAPDSFEICASPV